MIDENIVLAVRKTFISEIGKIFFEVSSWRFIDSRRGGGQWVMVAVAVVTVVIVVFATKDSAVIRAEDASAGKLFDTL